MYCELSYYGHLLAGIHVYRARRVSYRLSLAHPLQLVSINTITHPK
jgi:hypothetical protein